MSFEQDIKELLKKLENIPENFLKELEKADFTKELQRTHEKGQNPYRNSWASRKDNSQSHKLMIKTGKLKRSYEQERLADKLSIKNTAAYSGFHDKGTKKLPKRQLLPDNIKGLPIEWKKLVNASFKKAVEKSKK